MNIFAEIRTKVIAAVDALGKEGKLPSGLDTSKITAEPPRDASHGDVATNAAMVLAKPANQNPKALAELLVAKLKSDKDIVSATVAGPGFINLTLQGDLWLKILPTILSQGAEYGSSKIGQGRQVNVEFCSANPTGPMHVGHGRGTVVGDALSSLLQKVGYKVTREYYINDAGGQIETVVRSAFMRYREALGENIGEIPKGLYPGEYLIPVGQALVKKYGDSLKNKAEEEWFPLVRPFVINAMMDEIKNDLALLGVKHDVFTSELAMLESGAVDKMMEQLEKKDLIYVGVLEPPKGKAPDDWEPRPQTLFKASQFGDDIDRPLKKADGSYTYFAKDIAYHYDKYKRGSDTLIDILGADHGGYVKRMAAAVKAFSDGKCGFDAKVCQLIKLTKDGEPVKMSKRAGTFVTLQEVIQEVGKDVFRFIIMTRKNDMPMDFDLAKAVEQSKDNPVFYVQYAHARTHSVLRHAAEMFKGEDLSINALANADLSLLKDPEELALLKTMASWPRQVELAVEAHEPHRLAFFLSELAACFHALWNKGNENTQLRFLIEGNKPLSLARLALIQGMALVIASGLRIFGVQPLQEM